MKKQFKRSFISKKWIIKANIILLVILFISIGNVYSQTNPTAQNLPYVQNFNTAFALGSETVYPAGWQGWAVSATATPSGTGRTNAPTGDKALLSGTAASNGNGVYNYNQKIGILSSASTDNAICLAINATGATNVGISFDAMTIKNTWDGVATDIIYGLVLQYRVGISGIFTILPYNLEYQISAGPTQLTGTVGQNIKVGLNATLPSACDGQPIVQIRWIYRSVSGTLGAGGRPTMAIDNVQVGLSTTVTGGTSFSPGSSLGVNYSASATTGNFGVSGNVFTAQLSDATGSFASPTNFGTNSGTTSGSFIATLPGVITSGIAYRIRVISSNPALNGSDNGVNITIAPPITNYYYKGTGNLADIANWSTNTTGIGVTQPPNFTAAGQIFNIRNCTALATSAPWTVDGIGSKIVLNDNAAAPITLTITSGNDITTVIGGSFEIAGTGIGNTIVYQNVTPLSLSTIVDPSTNLIFDGASCVVSSATNRTFNTLNVINGASATFTGAPIFSSISVDATSTLATSNPTTNYITIIGNVTINGKFRTLKSAGMYTAPTTGTTGGALQPGGTLTIGPASTIEFARGTTGNAAAQTIDARTDYFNVIISNSGVASSKVIATGPTTIAGTLTMNTLVSGAVGTATLSGVTTVNGGLILTNGNIISTNANMLTLGAAASVSGGSNTSFVSGPITRNTNATSAFVLPLGKGTVYKPATINPISASAGIYVGEYFATGQGTTAVTSPLDNISTSEYWDIARTSGPDITLALQYAPTTWFNTPPDNTKSIGIAHLVTGSWIKESAVPIAGDATSGTVISTVLNSFSPFTFAAAPMGLLPLRLIEFNANKSTNGIQLTWKIDEDNSIAKYEVEKSYDARNFISFETVQSTTQLGEKNYTSFDANTTTGVIFYRLKMISNNGSIKYSNIVKIETNGKAGLSIYPNPITNNNFGIQMYKQPKGDYTIAVYSMDGKMMEQKQLNHNGTDGTRTVALQNNLPKGNYFIVVKNGNTKMGTYPVLIQ